MLPSAGCRAVRSTTERTLGRGLNVGERQSCHTSECVKWPYGPERRRLRTPWKSSQSPWALAHAMNEAPSLAGIPRLTLVFRKSLGLCQWTGRQAWRYRLPAAGPWGACGLPSLSRPFFILGGDRVSSRGWWEARVRCCRWSELHHVQGRKDPVSNGAPGASESREVIRKSSWSASRSVRVGKS